MIAQVVSLPSAVSAQVNVVFLAADAPLAFPSRLEFRRAQEAALRLSPSRQRCRLSPLQRPDEGRLLPRRRRFAWAMNSAGDIGGCFDLAVSSFFIRSQ